jgi:hypothetical protein
MSEEFKVDFSKFWNYKSLFVLLLIVYLIIQFSLMFSLNSLNGPVYGGDIYRDRGFIESVVQGFMPWEDGYYLGELQYYPWLYFAVLGFLANFLSFNIDKLMIFFPLVTTSLMLFIHYKIADLLFKKEWYVKFLYLFFIVSSIVFIGSKGTRFGEFVFLPASIYFFLKYELKHKHIRNLLYSGVFLGLTSLVHGSKFLVGLAFFAVYLLFDYFSNLKKNKLKGIWIYIKKYYSLFASAILVSLIYFLPLFLRYGGSRPNPVMQYGDTYITHLGIGWLLTSLKNFFFNFSSFVNVVISLFVIVGFVLLIMNFRKKESKILLSFFFTNLLILQHHQITRPLFNFWVFVPKLNYFVFFKPLFFAFGIVGVALIVRKFSKQFVKVAYGLVFILIFSNLVVGYGNVKQERWFEQGTNADMTELHNIGEYFKENLPNNKAVLANDETSFGLQALSGKKVMITRRTHASYFVDINERIKDAVLIWYSDNITLQRELLADYSIEYLYLDQFFMNYPVKTSPEFEQELIDNDILYVKQLTTLDPAQTPDKGFVTEMLIISPQNMSLNFDELFYQETVFFVNGNTYAYLFRYNETK